MKPSPCPMLCTLRDEGVKHQEARGLGCQVHLDGGGLFEEKPIEDGTWQHVSSHHAHPCAPRFKGKVDNLVGNSSLVWRWAISQVSRSQGPAF